LGTTGANYNMLSLAQLDTSTATEYLTDHLLAESRISKAKFDACGGSLPEIFVCARSGNAKQIRELLKKGTTTKGPQFVNERCAQTGRALLHDAAAFGHKGLAVMLCKEFGADINARTLMGGDTPLHLASLKNRRLICFILITVRFRRKMNELFRINEIGISLALFSYQEFGADPEIQNKYQETPVHYAAKYANMATVKCLVMYGGVTTTKNCDGKTPAQLAFERSSSPDDQEMVEYFLAESEKHGREDMLRNLAGQKKEMEEVGLAQQLERKSVARDRDAAFKADTLREYRNWRNGESGEPTEHTMNRHSNDFDDACCIAGKKISEVPCKAKSEPMSKADILRARFAQRAADRAAADKRGF
jgi:hypothetical protein